MKSELLSFLICPQSKEPLEVEETTAQYGDDGEIEQGWLIVKEQGSRYPITNSIPRFVSQSNYADNFGMQWNHFAKTQLDSHSGHPISEERFWAATGWKPEELKGQWMLDVGCGSGRFAEIALNAGAKVVALDYSSAVDACLDNMKHHPNLHVIQGDVYSLPLKRGSFPFVYSLGVLQHTPNVRKAFSALPAMVESGGRLCADFYWNRLRTLLNPKYLLRPITKKMDQQRLFALLERRVPGLLRTSQAIGRIPVMGRYLKRVVPVVDYTEIYPLSPQQLEEWALLDTFDMLAPAYDRPLSVATVTDWFGKNGFQDIEVFHHGHLVGRGRKQETGEHESWH